MIIRLLNSRRSLRALIFVLATMLPVATVAFSTCDSANDLPFRAAPAVTTAPVAPLVVKRGKSVMVRLPFRVPPGLHINSNKPEGESLVPTVLRLSAPTDVMLGKITYPPGQDFAFDFLPGQTVKVYQGDFVVSALVTTSPSVAYGTYRVHGALKYQACDNRQCYPPKEVPVQFDVKVQRAGTRRVQRNPGQSPHIH